MGVHDGEIVAPTGPGDRSRVRSASTGPSKMLGRLPVGMTVKPDLHPVQRSPPANATASRVLVHQHDPLQATSSRPPMTPPGALRASSQASRPTCSSHSTWRHARELSNFRAAGFDDWSRVQLGSDSSAPNPKQSRLLTGSRRERPVDLRDPAIHQQVQGVTIARRSVVT